MTSPSRNLWLWVIMVCEAVLPSLAQKAKAAPKPPVPTITIAVDASEAPRKIFHAQLTIPATPGTLTLYYPKWIPGEHGPTGPIEDLAGLKFTANGQELKWRRDLLDGWTIHVEVPAGASTVNASLDFISPVGHQGMFTAAASATDKMTVLSWNTVLLYPAGYTTDELTYRASLRLPQGWKFGTPLPIASQPGKEVSAEYSIGLLLDENGNIFDTVEAMPAAKAGIGPGMKVVAVNGKRFSEDSLNDVLRAAKNGSDPIELLVENTDYFKVYKLDYHGGERYPHLVRDESKPDVLTEIIKAR